MRAATIFSLLFALSFSAHAQPSTPATMEVVGATTFTGPVGYVLDDRLRVRIRDAQGRPWPGLNVEFGVRIGGMYFGGQTWPFGKYGVFATGDVPSSAERHFALTDAEGVATSLPYLVAYDSEGAWAQAISGFSGNGALGTQSLRVSFDITRGAGANPVALPAFSVPALLALIGGVLLLAVAAQRRRAASRALPTGPT